jgi:hypothetical protein
MAHVSPGPYLPLDTAPMLVGDVSTLADRIRPVSGRPMTFSASDAIRPDQARDLELVPFFRVHDSRYMLYWRVVAPDQYGAVVARLAAQEKERLALETRTIDRVTAGEQQPEVEHHVGSDGSTTGATNGRTWRDAGGWFSYELRIDSINSPRSTREIQPEPGTPATSARPRSTNGEPLEPLELLVTYWAGQHDRRFDILVNDRVIASVALDGAQPDRFVDAKYSIPADVVRASTNGVLTVTFSAKPGSRAGAVYDVRLLGAR